MAEDDRAVKAARAKALLKKRQQQKKNEAIASSSGTHSPGASISRVSTPALATQETSAVSNDTPLLSSPPPSQGEASASPVIAPHSENGHIKALSGGGTMNSAPRTEDYSRVLQDQRQTIALLVSEKTALTEALERLEGIDSKLHDSQAELQDRLRELEVLKRDVSRQEEEGETFLRQTRELEAQNSKLSSNLREQERELHSARTEAEGLRTQLKDNERRIRELQEQIQNDDRVDILESKLRNTQDRAEEVAIQLSKMKQTYEKLRADYEGLQQEYQQKSSVEEDLKRQVASLDSDLRSSEQSLAKISSERDGLVATNAATVAELEKSRVSIDGLNDDLSEANANVAALARQLETSQAECRQALRRAEDAEAAQRNLQEEGTGLMRSLDEMRPKIVELSSAKLALMEQLEQVTAAFRQKDNTISELEAQLESTRVSLDEARREYEKRGKELEKEKITAETGQADLQKAYNEVQARFDDTIAATREMEADRAKQRQMAARLQEEVDRLRSIGQVRQEEIDLLRSQMDEREQAGDDERRLLEELQQEIEGLRTDVANKEEEISRLHQAGPSTSPLPSSKSLDDEVKGAITQQLELEVSNTKSTIRSLESSLYDAEAKYLSLQKHVASMEDELAHLRTLAKRQRSVHAPRSSASVRHSDELRRSSFASQRSNNLSRLPPSAIIDEGLPPATRHRRHISLAMLQARMYSEAEAASSHAATKSSKTAASGPGHSHTPSVDSSVLSLRWPQFLDESHVFWCATCKGDLIVL
ncbi:hypothetical protein A7U60_g7208 [Sanghuangporus baumii]|uniref:Uncharacterized protein n=1 Tax=Sanghuangporus baumii TaxID=108892 RepID=A0A9Q5N582_SANBA|nr:hypothetical protein A7U60_g7208 [Sanghuangporus baumii]